MGSEWHNTGSGPTHDDKGELCVEHRTVLKEARNGAGYVVVACRCPGKQPHRG